MTRPATYKAWACPKCPFRLVNPIGLTAAVCPEAYHGKRREPVAMLPETVSGTTWEPPRESPGRRRGTMSPPRGGTGSQAQPEPADDKGTP